MHTDLSGKRILIVDDDPINLRLFGKIISQWGAVTQTAQNGKRAVEEVQANQETGTPFDLIVMDLQMPVMDGVEACRAIRAFDSSVIILAATANSMMGDALPTLGFNDFVFKPFDLTELRTKIEHNLIQAHGH